MFQASSKPALTPPQPKIRIISRLVMDTTLQAPPDECSVCGEQTLRFKTVTVWERDWFRQRNITLPDNDEWNVLPEPSVVPVEVWGCNDCYWNVAIRPMAIAGGEGLVAKQP